MKIKKSVNQIIKDVDVSGKLLELCPPRPSRMDDAEYLVWLYECVCLNVSMGIGGVGHCGDYGGLRREISGLIRIHLTPNENVVAPLCEYCHTNHFGYQDHQGA